MSLNPGTKVETVQCDDDKIEFKFHRVPMSIVNGLRRIMIEEVATLSIDTVMFVDYPHDHPFIDQTIAIRMGLIPVQASLHALEKICWAEECLQNEDEPCMGCTKCGILFEINVNYSTATVKKQYPSRFCVHSGSIVVDPQFEQHVKIPIDNISICEFNEHQQFKATGWIRKGNGKLHSKWGCASICMVERKPEDGSIHLIAEPIGHIKPQDMLPHALRCFFQKMENFPLRVRRQVGATKHNCVYIIEQEDHTLGQVLRDALLNLKDVSFEGYCIPHPLDNLIELRVQLFSTSQKSCDDILNEAVFNTVEILNSIAINLN